MTTVGTGVELDDLPWHDPTRQFPNPAKALSECWWEPGLAFTDQVLIDAGPDLMDLVFRAKPVPWVVREGKAEHEASSWPLNNHRLGFGESCAS